MKKNKLFLMIFAIFGFFIFINTVYAIGSPFNRNLYNNVTNGSIEQNIELSVNKVYNTITALLKVAAILGVTITGVKYMMAGSNEKAEIKSSLIFTIVGVIIVFAADTLIKVFLKAGIL